MKNILLFPVLLIASFAIAQDPCSDLNFVSIQYSPFTDTSIIVHVENNSSELFDYPGFVLIDSNGDTLAKEEVNFFGIGQESVHTLAVRPGVLDPTDDFVGELELHTGFYDTLQCAWQLNQSLCADTPCDSLIITFQNWGGALVLGDFHWIVTDSEQAVVDSGTFTMETQGQYWQHGLCLEPDTYNYSLTALGNPSGGGPVMTASSSSSFAAPSMLEYFEWFNQLTTVMEISFFSFCAEPPNDVPETSSSETNIHVFQDREKHELVCSALVKDILIYSVSGQLVSELTPLSRIVRLPRLNSGSYIAVLSTNKGEVRTKLIVQ